MGAPLLPVTYFSLWHIDGKARLLGKTLHPCKGQNGVLKFFFLSRLQEVVSVTLQKLSSPFLFCKY